MWEKSGGSREMIAAPSNASDRVANPPVAHRHRRISAHSLASRAGSPGAPAAGVAKVPLFLPPRARAKGGRHPLGVAYERRPPPPSTPRRPATPDAGSGWVVAHFLACA